MKKGMLFLFLASAVAVQAQEKQSLKDLLYAGKLKKDSSGVIRKTDDLSTKIDTSSKKEVQPEKTTPPFTTITSARPVNEKIDSTVVAVDSSKAVTAENGLQESVVKEEAVVKENTVPAKSNTRKWKDYTDSLAKSLKAEQMSSKKIKKDTYFFMVEYELEPGGQVSITNVTVTPENALLASQVKQIIETSPPQMNADANQTKKLKRRYSFSVTKE